MSGIVGSNGSGYCRGKDGRLRPRGVAVVHRSGGGWTDGGKGNESATPLVAKEPKSKPRRERDRRPAPGKGPSKMSPASDIVLGEIDYLLWEAPVLRAADFDGKVRQFLHAIHGLGGREGLAGGVDLLKCCVEGKARRSIDNWPGYICRILKTYFADVKRAMKAGGGCGQYQSAVHAPIVSPVTLPALPLPPHPPPPERPPPPPPASPPARAPQALGTQGAGFGELSPLPCSPPPALPSKAQPQEEQLRLLQLLLGSGSLLAVRMGGGKQALLGTEPWLPHASAGPDAAALPLPSLAGDAAKEEAPANAAGGAAAWLLEAVPPPPILEEGDEFQDVCSCEEDEAEDWSDRSSEPFVDALECNNINIANGARRWLSTPTCSEVDSSGSACEERWLYEPLPAAPGEEDDDATVQSDADADFDVDDSGSHRSMPPKPCGDEAVPLTLAGEEENEPSVLARSDSAEWSPPDLLDDSGEEEIEVRDGVDDEIALSSSCADWLQDLSDEQLGPSAESGTSTAVNAVDRYSDCSERDSEWTEGIASVLAASISGEVAPIDDVADADVEEVCGGADFVSSAASNDASADDEWCDAGEVSAGPGLLEASLPDDADEARRKPRTETSSTAAPDSEDDLGFVLV